MKFRKRDKDMLKKGEWNKREEVNKKSGRRLI